MNARTCVCAGCVFTCVYVCECVCGVEYTRVCVRACVCVCARVLKRGRRRFPGSFFGRCLEAAQLTSKVAHPTEVHLLDSLEPVDDGWRSLSHSISRWHGDRTRILQVGFALQQKHKNVRWHDTYGQLWGLNAYEIWLSVRKAALHDACCPDGASPTLQVTAIL